MKELLASVVNDSHPRVQVEVVDAVAHLRADYPDIDTILADIMSEDATVQKSLAYLDCGVEPAKGRSVPVLEVDPASQLKYWLWLGQNGDSNPVEHQVGKTQLPGTGLFRTFIHSDQPQPAIIAINHKSLDIRLNDSLVFSQDSLWSGDQQVNVELAEGLNVIEIHLKKGRRASKSLPPVFLYDPVGQALKGAQYLDDTSSLRASSAQHEKLVAERGEVITVQAVAGLKFAPTEIRVTPGSKVRLGFDNPDIMIHNWVLLTPGSAEEIGALADQLAAAPDGFQRGYLPESDKILVASKLLSPKEKQEIVFEAPKEPGEYPYICTFPGHWRVMKGILIVADKSKPNVSPAPESKVVSSDGVTIESANSPEAFKTLKPKGIAGAKVTANKPTNNDPISVLNDGLLTRRYGPIFGNGISDGAYKMDLGSAQTVRSITSWSYNVGERRGAQKLTLFASNAPTDPGWDLSKFARLGAINTGKAKANYTAASLRSKDGGSLGKFRWIVWSVSPVTDLGDGENTAFQELGVEIVGEDRSATGSAVNPAHSFPGEKTSFKGHDCYEFRISDNRVNIKIVCPKIAAPGKPWLWRSLFWEAIDRFNEADLQLVEQGYHVVLVHGDVAGHPSGNANIDAAYELLTNKYGFSKKCSMASMSRGTLSLFRWASSNPEKVESIYVDNGVCNVLSWPAGKLVPGSGSQASGTPDSWANFKKKFGYKTDEEALKTKESPIDMLEPLAKAGVPILMVCGSKDKAVPYEENDAIMEQRYKALGGDIRVIVEDKGHSHGMKDPTPVLEFIKKHTKLADHPVSQKPNVETKEKKPAPLKRTSRASAEPNIILVMTDDQGWGEVGFHGNRTIKTPNLDRFAAEGTELLNFYVSPMCTPTRSSLMTGRYHFRTGAHDTFIGRSNMRPQEVTIAEVLAGAGYRTGIFGKWHLGENYPMRAQDQGFQEVVVHGGGGIGQFADYPGNTYWDSTLLYNDGFKKAKGYCTDVFIDESIRFIEENRDHPFFCYIPLNIPHAPFDVHKKYHHPYEEQGVKDEGGRQWTTKIYGMITQFDEAFQRLLDSIEEMGLRENTIIIFMTDNGPNSIYYTDGLRARKGSVYENGFRSPFVIQWPKAMKGGRKFNDPAMHIDLLPTLAEAAGIDFQGDLRIDGDSILPLLTGETKQLPERYLFMQHNRANLPDRYRNFMVRKGSFKVVQPIGSGFAPVPDNPTYQLFNIHRDPGEENDLAAQHPDMVKDFVSQYDTWFTDVTSEMRENDGAPYPYELNPVQKQPYRFTWQCWFGPDAHWKSTAYGRWMMSNPGLIERFDVTIIPQRMHHGKPAIMKFIWQGKTIEKSYEETPSEINLKDIKLKEGTGFMEAQLQFEGRKWGVKEVQIKPHSSEF